MIQSLNNLFIVKRGAGSIPWASASQAHCRRVCRLHTSPLAPVNNQGTTAVNYNLTRAITTQRLRISSQNALRAVFVKLLLVAIAELRRGLHVKSDFVSSSVLAAWATL